MFYYDLPGQHELEHVEDGAYTDRLSTPGNQYPHVMLLSTEILIEHHLDRLASTASLSWHERLCTDAEQAYSDIVYGEGMPCQPQS